MLLTPAENPLALGHGHVFKAIEIARAQDRLPHVWLFVGPQGVGKRTTAYALIRHFLSQGRPLLPQDPLFQRIASETHGDFFLLFGSQVEHTQALQRFLQKAPVEGNLQIALLPNVDQLTPSATNALLKTLEEPTGHMLFFLTAQNLGAVLPTIRSRCRMMRLFPARAEAFEADLTTLCRAQALPLPLPETIPALAEMTQGCLGKALHLLASGAGENVPLLYTLLERGLLPLSDPRFQSLFHPKHIPLWIAFSKQGLTEPLLTWVQELIVQDPRQKSHSEIKCALSAQHTPQGWGIVYDTLRTFLGEAETFNVDPLQILMGSVAILRGEN